MAQFFIPSHEANQPTNDLAASEAAISVLMVQAARPVDFGLWGGDDAGKELSVKVLRGGTVVNEGRHISVTLFRKSVDPANHIQVFHAVGLKQGDVIRGFTKEGKPWTEPLPVREMTRAAGDVMKAWTQAYLAKEPFPHDFLFAEATPYLALPKTTGDPRQELSDQRVGYGLSSVHGLSVHCTMGDDRASPFLTANNRCVDTWNRDGSSAHFAISGDGTIIQFLPTSFVAFGQGDPADQLWISVEVDNHGVAPMNAAQLSSLRRLFRWVCARYHIRPALATGWLPPQNSLFDSATREVCARVGAPMTTVNFEAVLSYGLSCHWWLDIRKKGSEVHPCPGVGIITQLDHALR